MGEYAEYRGKEIKKGIENLKGRPYPISADFTPQVPKIGAYGRF